MSSEATSYVLNHSSSTGTDRLVLLVLANHCGSSPTGDAFECYPGLERIARQAGIARTRTVTDALGRLVKGGSIERIVNGAPDERLPPDKRPNLYRVLLDDAAADCGDRTCFRCRTVRRGVGRADPGRTTGVSAERTRGVGSAPTGVSAERTTGVSAERGLIPRGKPDLETEEQTDARGALFSVPDVEPNPKPAADDFERFYRAYPRHDAKPSARAAWTRALKRADAETIIAGAERWGAAARGLPRDRKRFVPYPATWLNADRWNDDPAAALGEPADDSRTVMQDRTPGVRRLRP